MICCLRDAVYNGAASQLRRDYELAKATAIRTHHILCSFAFLTILRRFLSALRDLPFRKNSEKNKKKKIAGKEYPTMEKHQPRILLLPQCSVAVAVASSSYCCFHSFFFCCIARRQRKMRFSTRPRDIHRRSVCTLRLFHLACTLIQLKWTKEKQQPSNKTKRWFKFWDDDEVAQSKVQQMNRNENTKTTKEKSITKIWDSFIFFCYSQIQLCTRRGHC